MESLHPRSAGTPQLPNSSVTPQYGDQTRKTLLIILFSLLGSMAVFGFAYAMWVSHVVIPREEAYNRAAAAREKRERAEKLLNDAIRDRIALLGMSKYEVILAKGRPSDIYKGDNLQDVERRKGGVELWGYRHVTRDFYVLFDRWDRVIFSDDAEKLPAEKAYVRRY